MSDNIFVDTNILVYSRDSSEAAKQARASEVLSELWKTETGRISVQVCNEYYVTVTQKLDPGLSENEAWTDIESLLAWQPLPLDERVLVKSRACQIKYQLSWWDSLVISAAFFSNCNTILSEDFSHGQEYFDIVVINPFTSDGHAALDP